MNRISVTVITLNEERNLPRLLASLGDVADEIVVADCGSADRTREIAEAGGARVFVHPWNGQAAQKNFAAEQAQFDWVLNLDADEELSAELRVEVLRWKASAATDCVAYSMPRRSLYLGQWIHHSGWYPDRKVRLYRRDVSRMDGLLHDSVRVAGALGRFDAPILHYTFTTFSEHIAKINRYTSLMAREAYAAGGRGWLVKLLVVPPWSFFRAYVLQQGFRDGTRGLLISVAAAVYGCLRYLKLGAMVMGLPVDPPAPPASR
jgi:glycosyltransferase involved in cell wall biosynthesis